MKMMHQSGHHWRTDTLSKKSHSSKLLLEKKSVVTQGPGSKEKTLVSFSVCKKWVAWLREEQASKAWCI